MNAARQIAACAAAALMLTWPAAEAEEAAPATVVFRNVKVLPMTSGEILPDRVVTVSAGRIVSIAPQDAATTPAGAMVIDGQGGTLIPGLIDLHTHLRFPEDLDLHLAHGVTTVVNLDGDPSHRVWRADLERGAREGPRLLSCGPHVLHVPDAPRAAETVEEIASRGYDCVKIYDDIGPGAFPALTGEARRRRLPTIAHIPRNRTWQEAMSAAPGAIAHAEEFLYSPVLEGDEARIADGMRTGGISLIATLIAYDTITRQIADAAAMLDDPLLRFLSPVRTRGWEPPDNPYQRRFDLATVPTMRWRLVFQRDLVRALAAAGVRILAGTDAGGPPFIVPGRSLLQELGALVDAGLTPHQALGAATRHAAEFLGRGADFGTLEPGKTADMVLLRANPLLNIDNVTLQAGVMARGRWYPAAALRARLDAHRALFEEEARFLKALQGGGPDEALAMQPAPRLSSRGLNEAGYEWLRARRDPAGAVRLFRAGTAMHPRDWNAWDSLAEALEAAGDPAAAIVACRTSLSLNPGNEGCEERLRRLTSSRTGAPGDPGANPPSGPPGNPRGNR